MSQQQSTVIDAWLNRGIGFACLGLALAISYSLANITWLFLDGPAEPEVGTIKSIVIEGASNVGPTVSLAAIRRWHLFGEAGKQPPKETVKKKDPGFKAPITRLPLVLNGVFQAEREEESSAIVAEKGKAGKLYKVGDKLPGNVILETVYEDRIILNQNGRLETLHFPKISTSSLAGSRSKGRTNSRRSKKTSNATKGSRGRDIIKNPKSRLGNLINQGRMPSTSELVSSMSEDAQFDVAGALSDLGLVPVPAAEGGGYKVGAGAPKGIQKALGLRENDIIRSVNGSLLGDITVDTAMLEELASNCTDGIGVEIARGSRVFTVNVPCS